MTFWEPRRMNDDSLFIRQATEADADALFALIQRAMAVYAIDSGIRGLLDSQKETLEDLKKHIADDYVLVALRRGRLVGTVRLVHKDSACAYFSRFAVLPHIRQTGIGRSLYLAAEGWLRANGYRQVILHTALTNPDLVAFYKARGFMLQSTSNERGYPRGTFRKNLDPQDR